MDDVTAVLDDIVERVASARAMPMSASCVVNREELLSLLAELRAQLPQSLDQASAVLSDREAVVDEGRAEADRLIEQAREERARMIAQAPVMQAAKEQAAALLEQARAEAETMRTEVEDYCDSKLANFEVVLSKTLAAVERGRDKLSGRHDLDALDDDDDARPLPG